MIILIDKQNPLATDVINDIYHIENNGNRRKRKWDAQGEDDTSAKKTVVNGSGASAEVGSDAVGDAAVAAAIAAAKINARLAAQGAMPTPEQAESTAVSTLEEGASFSIVKESKERDEFVADIDINDVKHRYVLTKGSVQTQVQHSCMATSLIKCLLI